MEDSSDILQNGGLDPNYVSENKTLKSFLEDKLNLLAIFVSN